MELLRFTTAGSVDDGKSTLIGRLLYDCGVVFKDQLAAIEALSQRKGLSEPDLALLMDGLSAEREQGITIDVAYQYFSTPKRRFIIADVPGHEQYTRNMVTGASTANLAVILVDATKGFLLQMKRHLFIATLLRIPHVLVAINKMDRVDYREDIYEALRLQISDYASKLRINDLQFIPISALKGDMVVERHDHLSWYRGYTLKDYLENLHIVSDRNLLDFRFPIQYVLRPHSQFRGYAGTIESGVIKLGDEAVILPSRKKTRIKSILLPDSEGVSYAFTPQAVVLTLEDEVDASRGDMIVRYGNFPEVGQAFEAAICWFSEEPLIEKQTYILKQTTKSTRCFVDTLRYRINMNTLHREAVKELAFNDIGRAYVKVHEPLCFDSYEHNRNTGSFILIDELTYQTVGAGIIWNRSPQQDILDVIA